MAPPIGVSGGKSIFGDFREDVPTEETASQSNPSWMDLRGSGGPVGINEAKMRKLERNLAVQN